MIPTGEPAGERGVGKGGGSFFGDSPMEKEQEARFVLLPATIKDTADPPFQAKPFAFNRGRCDLWDTAVKVPKSDVIISDLNIEYSLFRSN